MDTQTILDNYVDEIEISNIIIKMKRDMEVLEIINQYEIEIDKMQKYANIVLELEELFPSRRTRPEEIIKKSQRYFNKVWDITSKLIGELQVKMNAEINTYTIIGKQYPEYIDIYFNELDTLLKKTNKIFMSIN
jgi:hypothetical protein